MEPLTQSETQLLIALHSLRIRPQDRGNGPPLAPTAENLRRRGERIFREKLLDWSDAYSLAVSKEFATVEESIYLLTDTGREVAGGLHEQRISDEFSRFLLRSEASAAYSLFCRRVYGIDLCQFNMVDRGQLDKLIEVLKLDSTSRVLDLACGIGLVTEYLSDQTGAHVIGIDLAAQAVSRAQERTEPKRSRLEFRVGNLNRLDPALAGADTIVAIDSIYFADDLEITISQMKGLLRQDGQMGIFYSETRWDPDLPEDLFTAENTRLGRALLKAEFSYETWEYSAEELQLWHRQREEAEALKEQFVAEGNQEIYESRIKESASVLELLEAGKGRRYLYHARFGGGARP